MIFNTNSRSYKRRSISRNFNHYLILGEPINWCLIDKMKKNWLNNLFVFVFIKHSWFATRRSMDVAGAIHNVVSSSQKKSQPRWYLFFPVPFSLNLCFLVKSSIQDLGSSIASRDHQLKQQDSCTHSRNFYPHSCYAIHDLDYMFCRHSANLSYHLKTDVRRI